MPFDLAENLMLARQPISIGNYYEFQVVTRGSGSRVVMVARSESTLLWVPKRAQFNIVGIGPTDYPIVILKIRRVEEMVHVESVDISNPLVFVVWMCLKIGYQLRCRIRPLTVVHNCEVRCQ
ncbi:hypothetical protein TNCV_2655771 [Trichonephila clavipes]|nr:hypothetical protein TNCV_2655771 [Trichonephila clavipes]